MSVIESASVYNVVLTLLCCIVLKYLHICYRRWKAFQGKYHIPGPKFSTLDYINPLAYERAIDAFVSKHNVCMGEANLRLMMQLHSEHISEPMFRIFFCFIPVVMVYKPEAVESVLSHPNLMDKSDEYRMMHPFLGEGLLTSPSAKWKIQRKLLTPTFHFKILDDFMPIFNEQSRVLCQLLKSKSGHFDVVPLAKNFALDVICETAMGFKLNAQREGSQYIQSLREVTDVFLERIIKPWLHNDTIFEMSPLGRKFYKHLAIVREFTDKVMKQRKAEIEALMSEGKSVIDEDDIGVKKRRAFLDLLLHEHLANNSLTLEEVRNQVDTFMFGGHDTTSMGISFALNMIGLHPEVEDKLHAEMKRIFGDDRERSVTVEDLREMRYLEMVLKEVQRLRPSAPAISRRASADTQIGKYIIQEGSIVTILIYGLHRDPAIYEDPDKFDPERFTLESINRRHPYAYIPFSAGPRNCIGQKFAMMEMKTVMAHILRNMRIKSISGMSDVGISGEVTIRPVNGIEIEVRDI